MVESNVPTDMLDILFHLVIYYLQTMNWIDYKKLLNEESKIAVELDDYDDKWMRDYNDKWMRDYRDKWMRGYDDYGCMITMIKG